MTRVSLKTSVAPIVTTAMGPTITAKRATGPRIDILLVVFFLIGDKRINAFVHSFEHLKHFIHLFVRLPGYGR